MLIERGLSVSNPSSTPARTGPHLGLLFPIVLAASGHWRVFITAGIVATLMAIASWGAFGTETWTAFLANIGHTSQAFLSDG